MDQHELAKNMLADKICDNCKHLAYGSGIIKRCKKIGSVDIFDFVPEENTCKDWKAND